MIASLQYRPGAPALVAIGLLLASLAAGCQSYERRPLDLSAHRAAFLARTPDSPEVAEFARSLASDDFREAPTFDPGDGVSLPEAEAIALIFNADLRMARLRAGVTQAGAANAGLWEDPTIGVDLTRIIQHNAHPWKLASAIGFTIPISGRLEIEKARAGVEHAADLARAAENEWLVRMDLRRAWADWSALTAQVETTRAFLERVEQILKVVDLMERAGELARTEARLFRVEHASKALELTMLEAQVAEETLRIKRLLGLSPTAAVMLVSSGIAIDESELSEADSLESLQLRLMQSSPLLFVASTEYELAERTLELEIRKQYPDLQIGPGYGFDDGQDELLLGLSLPIPIFNGNRRAIAEARAARELARAGAETALEQLIAELADAQLRLRTARTQSAVLADTIVPMVDAQYADAREVARLGEVNTLVLLESLKRQQEAKIGLIIARRDEAIAAIRVTEIVGPANPEPVTEPAEPQANAHAGASQ